jgi:hypothetical protein
MTGTAHASRGVVFIITDETAQLEHIRAAVGLDLPILPIKASGTKLTGWVSIAIAGKIYYEVDPSNAQQPHMKYKEIEGSAVRMHDSTPATDLTRTALGMVGASHKPRHSAAGVREEIVRRATETALHAGVSQSEIACPLRFHAPAALSACSCR